MPHIPLSISTLIVFVLAICIITIFCWNDLRAKHAEVRLKKLDFPHSRKTKRTKSQHVDLFMTDSSTWMEKLRKNLERHVVHIGGPSMVWLLLCVIIISCVVLAFILSKFEVGNDIFSFVAIIAGPIVVGVSVYWHLKRRWQLSFLNGFAEAIELVIRASRSGIPVSEAIRVAGREIADPVRSEFRLISDALDLGIDLKDALRVAAKRVALPDFDFLVTALILQRETGGQLVETLENLATILRRRKELRLKVRAMTAEGRMSAIVVGAIPVVAAVAMYLLDPQHIERLFIPGTGRSMLYFGLGLLVSGIGVIRFLTRVRP